MPLARNVVKDVAAEHGACLRPVQLRRTDIDTGHVEQVLIPCGHTLASVCPPCAERARMLRAAQCREGWHLDHEPVIDPDPATEDRRRVAKLAARSPHPVVMSTQAWTAYGVTKAPWLVILDHGMVVIDQPAPEQVGDALVLLDRYRG